MISVPPAIYFPFFIIFKVSLATATRFCLFIKSLLKKIISYMEIKVNNTEFTFSQKLDKFRVT